MPEEPYRAKVSPLSAGLACRCPRCGQGRLFDGYLTVRERCSACGLDLRKADSGDGPAIFIIFIMGSLVVPAALLMEVTFEPPYWLHVTIWPAVILIGSLGLLRPFKGLMIGLQFRHNVSDSGPQNDD